MERSQRIGLLVAAAVVAVVAVILISNGDDDDSSSTDSDRPDDDDRREHDDSGKPAAPEVPTITIKDGEPVGGVQEIRSTRTTRSSSRSSRTRTHEIHLHGYDIMKDVEAGGQVCFKLTADIEGIFEIEIEDLKEQIAEPRVKP